MLNAPIRTLRQEDELIGLLRCRQERGFNLLYKLYAPNLYGVALRIVRSPAVAEDVVQETFVKVWRNINAYDPAKGRLFTWLLNIVRNTALDQWRAQQRNIVCHASEEYLNPSHQSGYGFRGQLPVCLLAVDHFGLDTLLKSLSPEHQLVVEYFYLRGYSHAEAAQTLGVPLGTVKTRVRSALIHLRELAGESAR